MSDPLTRPAPAEESAGAAHPLPQGGEGRKLRRNSISNDTAARRSSRLTAPRFFATMALAFRAVSKSDAEDERWSGRELSRKSAH
jgi:hypothetical protein